MPRSPCKLTSLRTGAGDGRQVVYRSDLLCKVNLTRLATMARIHRKAILGITVVIVLTIADFGGTPRATDADLRQRWAENQSIFNELLAMLQKDQGIKTLTSRFILWDDGEATGWALGSEQRQFDPARWSLYRSLLKRIGCHGGIEIIQSQNMVVFVQSTTALFSNTTKGIAYRFGSKLPPWIKVVENLDKNPNPGTEGVYVCPISGSWYIYFSSFD